MIHILEILPSYIGSSILHFTFSLVWLLVSWLHFSSQSLSKRCTEYSNHIYRAIAALSVWRLIITSKLQRYTITNRATSANPVFGVFHLNLISFHFLITLYRDYVQAKLREAGVSNTFVRCPLRNCSRPLTDFDLRHCSTDKKTLDTFIHFATLRFIHSFPCPKCPAQISVTAEQRKNFKSVVRCAQCKSSHLVEKLLSAPLPKNNGARLLLDLASKGGWQFCPGIGCGELVERIDGCNVMNHSKCGTHFCYLCGMKLNGYQTSHYTNGSFSPCVQKVSPAQLL